MARLLITDMGELSPGSKGSSIASNARKLVKLVFGSYTIILIALNLLALAVSNGDLFADFTGGLVINLDEFLSETVGGMVSYLSSLVISAFIFVGPLHYYAVMDRVSIIIVLLITYCLTSLALGRMFKHPAWGFVSGFAVMASFVITISLLVNALDYIAGSFGLPVSLSTFIYPVFEGMFGMDVETLFMYSILENGAFMGAFAMFWGAAFSPEKKNDMVDIGFDCDRGDICKV